MSKWLWIEPCDRLFLRDGQPFLGGGNHVARSVFPPTPQTMQGALRALILAASNVGWKSFRQQSTERARALAERIGHPEQEGKSASLGTFGMQGPFLARREGNRFVRYVSLPADVRRIKDTVTYLTLQPTRGDWRTNWPADAGLYPLWPSQENDLEMPEEREWLGDDSLWRYLRGKSFTPCSESELFGREQRLGIALDRQRRRPLDGMLYQVEMIRPGTDMGLLVQMADTVTLPADSGMLLLGGQSRCAYYQTLSTNELSAGEGIEEPVTRLKLLFTTPAYFDGGWQPAGGDRIWSALLGHPVRLVSAALGRPQPIGGWDLAARGGRGWHKPLYSFVPAGSVYFFDTDTPVVLQSTCISQTPAEDTGPALDRLGFGNVVVGTWDWLD